MRTNLRNIFFTFYFLLFTCSLSAKEIYEVPLASSGNTIELTISNSTTTPLAEIQAIPSTVPQWLTVTAKSNRIDHLKAGDESSVLFSFSVDKKAPLGSTANIGFTIESANGQSWSEEIAIQIAAPQKFELVQNYPNPFNPQTTIGFFLPDRGNVHLAIFNILGQQVSTQDFENMEAGYHEVNWDGRLFASGTYIFNLEYTGKTGKRHTQQKKMVLLK